MQKQGLEQGLERGRKERDLEIARQLLAEGEPPERVARLTGLSLLELQQKGVD